MSFLSNIAYSKIKFYQKIKRLWTFIFIIFVVLTAGCSSKQSPPPYPDISPLSSIPRLGFTIQIGAFVSQDNAIRLEKKLHEQGIEDAFYFVEKGRYKVRFGNFATYRQALSEAMLLQDRGSVVDYYIVRPENFAINRKSPASVGVKLVSTAEGFLGIPYKWGGVSVQSGFDCSGLSMVVYKLNGINLPRTSRMQYKTGKQINSQDLAPGDLVFFSTNLSGKVNHVGIYKGDDYFIHAPRRGKRIKVARLNSKYFKARYLGARRYL